MKSVITIANQKGGVGKTATASAIASSLIRRGYNVLMIDADPQGNTTDIYRAKIEGQATLFDLMIQEATAKEAIQITEFGDIIASDPQLIKADNTFLNSGREYLLKEAIESIKEKYDFIVIDTLPGLGVMLLNALTAADGIVIPIGADRDSLQGLKQLSDTINATKKYSNKDLRVYGLLVTMYFPNTKLSKEITEEALPKISSILNTKIFETRIRYTTKVKEAKAKRVPLLKHSQHSTAAEDYETMVDELLNDIEREK